jgi:alpha-L-arabinofuranosidase
MPPPLPSTTGDLRCIEPGNAPATLPGNSRLRRLAAAALALWGLVLPAWSNDDVLVYSGYITSIYGTTAYNNGWGDWGWVPHYATNNPTYNGSNSMVFAASSGWQAWYLVHDPIDTTIYSSLTLRLNGGATGGQTVGVQAQKGSVWGPRINVNAPTNAWQQFTFPLVSLGMSNATDLQAIQIWNNATAQPKFFIADIRLVAAPAPSTVHVSVSATQTVRTVDAKVFGVNQVAWDGAVNTTTTISLLNDLGNPCLRWPGGSWGDGYHWTNEYRGWGSYSSDFIAVATNTHAEAFIIVNYGSSTPEEAAYGVRMFNVTNHCNFKYWEVGNEVGGSWEEDNNTNAPWQPHDPWTYAMRFTNYYAQMKAVDPTIKIGAVADITEDGTSNYTNHPVVNPRTGVTHNGWTPVMLTYMRSNNVIPDFVIEHKYAPSAGDTYNLLWSSTWASDAAGLRQMLNDYLGSAATNVTLECSETGCGGDRQSVSLVGGLFYADSIGQVLQTEFRSRLWWDFRNGEDALSNSDPSYYGWRTNTSGAYISDGGIVNGLGSNPSTRYPTFYCAKLMTRFAAGGDTVVSATSDHPLLGAYAVRRTNGCLSLLLINKSSYTNLNTTINLAGYAPSPGATVYSYGIPQDEAARSGIGSPDIVQTNFPSAGASFSTMFPPYSATVIRLVPAAPVLVMLPGAPTGQFVFQVQGLPGVPYVIEKSTDLAGANWLAISTNTTATGTLNFTNAISSGAEFYRAVWKP